LLVAEKVNTVEKNTIRSNATQFGGRKVLNLLKHIEPSMVARQSVENESILVTRLLLYTKTFYFLFFEKGAVTVFFVAMNLHINTLINTVITVNNTPGRQQSHPQHINTVIHINT
jgi:predicted Zn-dependent protease